MKFVKRIRPCLYTVFLVFILLLFYGIAIEPQLVEVSHVWLSESPLGDSLQGKTAIHISDLHMSKIGCREKRVLKIIDEIKPDLIFLTGDYVKWKGDYKASLDYLSQIKAKAGAWAVMGDYDYSNSRQSCLFCHERGTGTSTSRHSIQFLRNNFEGVSLSGGTIFIGGIEQGEGSGVPEIEAPSIILSHSPLLFDEVDASSDILMLAGDTHGGQVPLPRWFWKLIGYEKTAKYSHGLFREGNKMLYVSRGIGTSHFPIRLLRRPEVVVFHF
jgi:predicted MPP superfamily phosphohydrolase